MARGWIRFVQDYTQTNGDVCTRPGRREKVAVLFGASRTPAADWLGRFRPCVEMSSGSAAEVVVLPAIVVSSYTIRRPRPPKGEIQWDENGPLIERGVGQVKIHLRRKEGEEDVMEHLKVDKLREEFNRASASVRIVAVFSPT